MTREELYSLVWSEPMVHVAKRLGLSDRGLAKRCKSMDVPVPPRGYWARLQAGYNSPRIPLVSNELESGSNYTTPDQGPRKPPLVAEPAQPVVPTPSQHSIASDAEYQAALSESAAFERHSRLAAYVDAVLAASVALNQTEADFVCQWASSIRQRAAVDNPARQRLELLARRCG